MLLYSVGRNLLWPVGKLVFRLKFRGRENLPEGGVILCSNHKSVIDPAFLAFGLRRQIRFMGKSELFDDHGAVVRNLLYGLGAFPVRRNATDAESVRRAVSVVREGGILGIFPQGGCVPDNLPLRPKAGAALIAQKTGAGILPACIYCDGPVKPFRRTTVRFGRAIPPEELGFTDGSRTELRRAAQIVADRINSLLEEKHED